MKTFLAALAASVLVLAGCNSNGRVQNTTDFRALNAIVDAEPLDFVVNGDVKVSAVAFGDTSGYTTFTAGNSEVRVRSSTTQAVLYTGTFGLGNAVRNTVVAYGRRDAAATLLLGEDTIKASSGHARVRVAQLAPDGGTVDVYIGTNDTPIGTPFVSGLSYPIVTNFAELPSGNLRLIITTGGSSEVLFAGSAPRNFQDGGSYTLIVMPSKGGKFVNALFLEQGTGGGTYLPNTFARVKAVNGIPGTTLNVKLDGTPVLSQVTFTGASNYLATSSGQHTVSVEQANIPGVTFAQTNATFDSGRDYTTLAAGTVANPRLVMYTDDNSAPPSGFARVRYVNALVDGSAADVQLNTITQAAGLVPFVATSYFLTAPGTNLTLSFTTPGGVTTLASLSGVTIEAGGVYTGYLFGTVGSPQALLVRDR